MVNPTNRLLFAAALAFALLGVAGYAFPTSLTWGFHSFGFLAPVFLPAAVLLALLSAYLLGRGDPEPVVRKMARTFSGRRAPLLAAAAAALAVALAFFFRIGAPLLGDGIFLVKNFTEAFQGAAPLPFRDQPLATAYFWGVFRMIGTPASYQEFLRSFLIADCMLALLFILTCYAILKRMVADPVLRLLGLLLLTVLPSMQLFFGYVETRAAAAVAIALYALSAVVYLRGGGKSFVLVTLAFLLMGLTDYLTFLLLPSLLLLSYREYRRGGGRALLAGFGIPAGLLLGILIAVNFDLRPFHSAGSPDRLFLSTAGTENAPSQAYGLLSPFHLLDILNLLLLLIGFPVALLFSFPALARAAGKERSRSRGGIGSAAAESAGQPPPSPAGTGEDGAEKQAAASAAFGWPASAADVKRFFALALIPVLIALCVVRFDLGAARRWDAFAPYAFLAALWAILLISESGGIWAPAGRTFRVRFLVLVLFLSLLQSVSYWSVNASAGATLGRTEALLDTRTMSHDAYYAASLQRSEYFFEVRQESLATESWKAFNRRFPDDPLGYQNLIISWTRGGHAKVDEMTAAYERWIALAPEDSTLRQIYRNFCLNLGNGYFNGGELAEAARFYEKTIALDSSYANAHNNLGSIYAQEGNIDRAIDQYRRAIALNPAYGEAYYNLGNAFADKGRPQIAHDCYVQAAALNVAEAKAILLLPQEESSPKKPHAHPSH